MGGLFWVIVGLGSEGVGDGTGEHTKAHGVELYFEANGFGLSAAFRWGGKERGV